ncbi:hypothetical protein BC827DRAFT_235935 [Russula dissimulans]|nr:hypothetical protein BC827DRAFT_235935 [Russula dissimulans]
MSSCDSPRRAVAFLGGRSASVQGRGDRRPVRVGACPHPTGFVTLLRRTLQLGKLPCSPFSRGECLFSFRDSTYVIGAFRVPRRRWTERARRFQSGAILVVTFQSPERHACRFRTICASDLTTFSCCCSAPFTYFSAPCTRIEEVPTGGQDLCLLGLANCAIGVRSTPVHRPLRVFSNTQNKILRETWQRQRVQSPGREFCRVRCLLPRDLGRVA